jgi:hypothetical protein
MGAVIAALIAGICIGAFALWTYPDVSAANAERCGNAGGVVIRARDYREFCIKRDALLDLTNPGAK